jgi:hypothetical protein
LGFGVQRKLRVVSLQITWFQIDAVNFRGHLDLMMPNLNGFGYSFRPIDLDSGSVRVRRRRLCRGWPLAVEQSLFSHGQR